MSNERKEKGKDDDIYVLARTDEEKLSPQQIAKLREFVIDELKQIEDGKSQEFDYALLSDAAYTVSSYYYVNVNDK